MSVIIIVKVPGDPAAANEVFHAQSSNMAEIAKRGREAGAIHHRFAAGTNEVIIVDEWTSADAFQQFFGDPEIADLMKAAGAQGPPDISIYEAMDTPDAF